MTDYTLYEMYEKGDREEKRAMSRVIEMVCHHCGMIIWVSLKLTIATSVIVVSM